MPSAIGGVPVCSLADLTQESHSANDSNAVSTPGAGDPAPRDAFAPVKRVSIGRRLNVILAWTMEAGGMVACGGWRLPGAGCSLVQLHCSVPVLHHGSVSVEVQRGGCRTVSRPCRVVWGLAENVFGGIPVVNCRRCSRRAMTGSCLLPGLTLPWPGTAKKRTRVLSVEGRPRPTHVSSSWILSHQIVFPCVRSRMDNVVSTGWAAASRNS